MWVIKMVLQAFALFAVPVMVVTLYTALTGINNSKATGIGILQAYGPFFVLTGLCYVAFGALLWSPLPGMLLRHLMAKHLNLG